MEYYIIAALVLLVIRLEYTANKLKHVIKGANENFYAIELVLSRRGGIFDGTDRER